MDYAANRGWQYSADGRWLQPGRIVTASAALPGDIDLLLKNPLSRLQSSSLILSDAGAQRHVFVHEASRPRHVFQLLVFQSVTSLQQVACHFHRQAMPRRPANQFVFSMDFMKVLFLIVVALVAGSAHRVLFYRMRKGYFSFRLAGQNFALIETNFGKFHLDYRRAKMAVASRWRDREVSLDEISALQFRHRDESAFYEEACNGFDVTDLLSAHRDRIHWYTINLLLRDGAEIPVFTAGEYEPREFMAGWLLEFEAGIFERLGLKPDVAGHARTVLDQFLAEFRKAGRTIPLQ